MPHAAPDIRNYYIGKGTVEFKPTGGSYRELGNVPVFEFTPEIEKLEHFSAQEGVKSRDRTVIVSKKGSLKIEMDEFVVDNLAMAMLGDISTNTDGRSVIDIFSQNAISGTIRFTGTNEVGPRYEIVLPLVDFIPGESVSFIGEEFGSISINGDVQKSGGTFGTMTEIAEEDSEV